MSDLLSILLVFVAVCILIAAVLWFFVPLATGLPWVPSHDRRIRRSLRMADLKPGELLFDLGAGDGRVLIMAVREFNARAVGIEISPIHCVIAWLRSRLSGYQRSISIRCSNFLQADLSNADVIYAYMPPGKIIKLREKLATQLKSGARVITVSSEMEGWQPENIDRSELAFLYRMPPTSGSIVTYLAETETIANHESTIISDQ